MSPWNYRRVRVAQNVYGRLVTSIAIYEVYYNSQGMPEGRTETPSYPMGTMYEGDTDDPLDEFNKDFNCYLRATVLPILVEVDGKLVEI